MVRLWEHSTGAFRLNPLKTTCVYEFRKCSDFRRQFSTHTIYSIISSVGLGQHLLTKHINISFVGCVSIRITYAYSHYVQLIRITHSFMALHGPDFATKVSYENFSVFRVFSCSLCLRIGNRLVSSPSLRRDSWASLCEGTTGVPQPTAID